MAQGIIITGSTNVLINGSILGSTDADNNINVKAFTPRKKIHTNLSGPELYEKIINLGLYAIITVPFIKLDESVFATMAQGNAGSEGQLGVLGGEVPSFTLTLSAAASGESWVFPATWLEDHYEVAKFGYEPQITNVTFLAQVPTGSNFTTTNVIYTNS